MCVDFIDPNKACPKDSYPLPSIDALVDNAAGCKLLSFLDAFSGYNQLNPPRANSRSVNNYQLNPPRLERVQAITEYKTSLLK